MTTRDPARLRRLDPAGKGGRQGRRPGRLATRSGVAAGVLLGVLLAMVVLGRLPGTTVIPGLLPVALVAAVAWPASAWVAGRSAAARRLAIRREAAPAVLDLLGAALLAGLNPHKAVLRVAERAPEVLHQDLGLAAAVLRLGGTPAAALRAAADRSGLDELRAAAAALEAAERWGARLRRRHWPPERRPFAAVPGSTPRPKRAAPPSASPSPWSSVSFPPSSCSPSSRRWPVPSAP
jgi:Flp pilus assembly protein TadB